MERKKAWVWFKGGLNGGSWISGFMASEHEDGGLIIEKPDFITCRVPHWRVSFEAPNDDHSEPKIPPNPTWKYN